VDGLFTEDVAGMTSFLAKGCGLIVPSAESDNESWGECTTADEDSPYLAFRSRDHGILGGNRLNDIFDELEVL
jgi:hypothetical protein